MSEYNLNFTGPQIEAGLKPWINRVDQITYESDGVLTWDSSSQKWHIATAPGVSIRTLTIDESVDGYHSINIELTNGEMRVFTVRDGTTPVSISDIYTTTDQITGQVFLNIESSNGQHFQAVVGVPAPVLQRYQFAVYYVDQPPVKTPQIEHLVRILNQAHAVESVVLDGIYSTDTKTVPYSVICNMGASRTQYSGSTCMYSPRTYIELLGMFSNNYGTTEFGTAVYTDLSTGAINIDDEFLPRQISVVYLSDHEIV